MSRKIYVIDTNVLVDYPDIIPYETAARPEQPTVEVETAHLIIPSAVIRENSSFKKEHTERGYTSRIFLKNERNEVEKNPVPSMEEVYNLEPGATIKIGGKDTPVSLLPVHKSFKRCLPFAPSDTDMDGQIILTTLAVMALEKGLPIDGSADIEKMIKLRGEESGVVLLTNDNGLAIRAWQRGIRTSRYGYKYPEPYTGRRDIVVPKELFHEFFNTGRIERDFFETMLPSERKLVANEFIIMRLENRDDYPQDFDFRNNPHFFHIGRYDRDEDAVVRLKYVKDFPCRIKTDGQATYAEALMNPDIAAVICTGPAGSGKTYVSTIFGYSACRDGRFIGVTVVPCENHSDLGALPGDLDEKMDPDLQPLKNALRNYLLTEDPKFKKELENLRKFGVGSVAKAKKSDSDKSSRVSGCEENEQTEKRSIKERLRDRVELIWKNWFSSVPIKSAKGRDFAYELAIYDEFQDQNISEADTLIKRIGAEGKIVLTGDVNQVHAPYLDELNNGLVYASRMLYDDPMVAQVCFTEKEVVRHPLVKLIAERQKTSKNTPPQTSADGYNG